MEGHHKDHHLDKMVDLHLVDQTAGLLLKIFLQEAPLNLHRQTNSIKIDHQVNQEDMMKAMLPKVMMNQLNSGMNNNSSNKIQILDHHQIRVMVTGHIPLKEE